MLYWIKSEMVEISLYDVIESARTKCSFFHRFNFFLDDRVVNFHSNGFGIIETFRSHTFSVLFFGEFLPQNSLTIVRMIS